MKCATTAWRSGSSRVPPKLAPAVCKRPVAGWKLAAQPTFLRSRWTIPPLPPPALLSQIVFSAERTALRDVVVGGNFVVRDGRHPLAGEIVHEFTRVERK